MIDRTVLRNTKMTEKPMASRLAAVAPRLPLRSLAVSWITRREGGQLTSRSLRAYLARVHGVVAGEYSYGSLLEPGRADRGLTIGRYVSIGPNVRRFGAAHPVDALSMHPYWYNPALSIVDAGADVQRTECVIEHEAWIGANVTILPGCRRIGIGAVVGAGTVLTKDVPDFAIVVGNPGRSVGERLTPQLRRALLDREPWLLDPLPAADVFAEIAAGAGNARLFAAGSPAPEEHRQPSPKVP